MVKLFQQGDFTLDPNTTPEMLKAKRERLAAMMPQYCKAKYIGEGLTQLLHGIGSGRSERAMDGYEGERSAEAAQQFAAATGGPMSILGMRQQDQPTAGMGQPAQPTISTSGMQAQPNAPEAIGADTMSALGKAPATNGAFDIAAKQIGLNERDQKAALSDYLQTGGQSLDPATTAWCAAFVNATLKQSGTEGTGKLNARSYMDWGQAVDKPQRGDVAVFSRGDPNGWQGHVGFFDSYNPDGTIKVLGGNQGDSVSLANYSPENLLGFRRAAEGGAPTQGQPMQGGQDMDALLQAQANPWLTQSQRAVLDGMISQRQSQQAAAEDRYWRQNDPAYQQGLIKGQLEIDAMRNPAPQKRDTQFIKGIGLVDSQTGETVNDFGGTGGGSADGTEYGLTPQYGVDADGNPVLIQLGKDGTATQTPLPDGVRLSKEPIKMDAGTHFILLDPITRLPVGTIPKDSQAEAANKARGTAIGGAQGDAQVAAAQDLQAGQNALDLLNSLRTDPNRTAGTGASALFNGIPATKGYDFNAKVEQAKSGAFMTAIQQMRGMGALSNAEGSTATAAVTRMNAAMSEEGFLAALDDYEKIIKQGMAKAQRNGAGQQAAPQAPPQDGTQNNDPLGLFQ